VCVQGKGLLYLARELCGDKTFKKKLPGHGLAGIALDPTSLLCPYEDGGGRQGGIGGLVT